MRIVHLIWGLDVGGAESIVVDIVNNLCIDNDVSLIIVNRDYSDSLLTEIAKRVNVRAVNRPKGSRHPWHLLKAMWMLRILRPEIVHAHQENLIRLMRCVNAKKVLTIHKTHASITAACGGFDLVCAISDAVAEDVEARSAFSVSVVRNGVPLSRIVSKTTYGNVPFRVVQIGRLEHEIKGQDVLLKAIGVLVRQHDVVIDFIGEGDGRQYLEGLACSLGLGERCRFLGAKSRAYIHEHLHTYDLLVQPSRQEGFGLAIVEAMVAGVPVLVSNIEGPMEIINEGQFGHFFEVGNYLRCAEGIANTIVESRHTNFARLMAMNGQYARNEFDVRATAQRYLEHYARLLCAGDESAS